MAQKNLGGKRFFINNVLPAAGIAAFLSGVAVAGDYADLKKRTIDAFAYNGKKIEQGYYSGLLDAEKRILVNNNGNLEAYIITAERDLPMLQGQMGLRVGDSQYGWNNLNRTEQGQFVVQGWSNLESNVKEDLTLRGYQELPSGKKSQLVLQGLDYLDETQKKELTKKGWKSLDYGEKAGLAKDVIGDALQEGYQKIGSLFENLKDRLGIKNGPST